MGTTTTAPSVNVNQMISRITRDQGPEFEQTLQYAALTQVSTPTSLRTDRKIKMYYLHFRGRVTNAASPGTYRTNTLLGTAMFSLIQQFTLRGQHLRYGSQTPFVMRAEFAVEMMALMNPNYVPRFTNSDNGGAVVVGKDLVNTASHTNDIDFSIPIPTFPLDLSPSDQQFYCIHGPDWPGNLYFDILCADVTALGVTTSQSSLSAYGSASGNPTIDILSVRPLLSKALASQIRPAITFRVQNTSQPTTAVSSGAGGTGTKLGDLIVGKDTARIFAKFGTAQTGESAGVAVYASLSDAICTRTFVSLDSRQLRFQNANADSTMNDYMGMFYGRTIPVGYRMIDFISGVGTGTANPKAAFQSSQLTAARKFELDGDIVEAGTNQAEYVQEMILGRPALLSANAGS